jgi:hypothetical protein
MSKGEHMNALPDVITRGDKYDPAMRIVDQKEADAYFELLVEHTMRMLPCERTRAEDIERSNLGYWAGYCSNETRARVERLFKCSHPVFGSIAKNGAVMPKQAFQMGVARARKESP